jgi:tetratricopeptide (TPR) repeat protein
MTVDDRTCPYCETLVPEGTTVCPGCHEDVAGLLHLAYAHAIYYNEALELAQQGELERARDSAHLSLRLHPTYRPALMLMARLAAQEEQWSEAHEYAVMAQELNPDDAEVKDLLAEVVAAEAEQRAARHDRMMDHVSQQRSATERFLAIHQRELLQAALYGAILGGALVEAGRWLIQRQLGRARG